MDDNLELATFALRIVLALVLGMAIGIERQYHQHPAGLRTNALVCLGAAMFVSLSTLMNDTASPTRVASYVVSGIGFLGGGVILREGLNVRGLNTAATLWCTAAIGSLVGAGRPWHAAVGAATILFTHVALRPLVFAIEERVKVSAVEVETIYRIAVVGPPEREGIVRAILTRHVNSVPKMSIQGISTQACEGSDEKSVVAEIFSVGRNDKAMEEVVSRLNIEPELTSVRWERTR
jgi:putative Mg2+ transporter-C (MgtC) family protein